MNKEYEYFKDCKGIEQAKRLWKALAMVNHPDHGGSNEVMSEINAEYFAFVKQQGLDTEAQAKVDANGFKAMGLNIDEWVEAITNVMGGSKYAFLFTKVWNVAEPFVKNTWKDKPADDKHKHIEDVGNTIINLLKAYVK